MTVQNLGCRTSICQLGHHKASKLLMTCQWESLLLQEIAIDILLTPDRLHRGCFKSGHLRSSMVSTAHMDLVDIGQQVATGVLACQT